MKNFLLFFLLTCSIYGSAQDYSKISALKQQVVEHPKDTVLIKSFISLVIEQKNNNDSVNSYLDFIIDHTKKHNLQKLYVDAVSWLGSNCVDRGAYSKALYYLLPLEKILIKLKNYDKLASLYSLIGNTYLGLENSEEQKIYFQKCYEVSMEHDLTLRKAYGAGGLASYYENLKDFKSSIKWNEIAIKHFKEENFIMGYSILTCNLAANYRMLNQYSKAKATLESIEPDIKKLNHNYASHIFYQEKGNLEMATGKEDLAIKSYQASLELMLKDNAIHNISIAYENLSRAYEKAGFPAKALNYLKLHLNFKDSVFNEESNRQLVDIKEKYETEQKDVEIRLLNRENQLNKSEIIRKRTTIYAFIGGAILLAFMLLFFIKSNIRKNKTNQLLAQQKVIIEKKQKEIVDSINYAKRIQFTLLASDNLLNTQLEDHFVYFEPKDIVSGDFYWGITKGDKSYLAVCDCTGHGVPGAFMSLLNINFLNEAITEKNIEEPGDIFNFVRRRLVDNLSSDGAQDGMDGILICVNKSTNIITYAAANNSPLVIHQNKITSMPYDRMPVGKGIKQDDFKTYTVAAETGDFLYLYTDGFMDQFGGPKGKKYMHNQLKELLLTIHQQPLLEQRLILKDEMRNWKGDLEQVDDICMIGLRI